MISILFRLVGGVGLFLHLFLGGIQWGQEFLGLEPGAISLAAFHTSFIALGMVLFLPFVDRFSRWIERLLPEKGQRWESRGSGYPKRYP